MVRLELTVNARVTAEPMSTFTSMVVLPLLEMVCTVPFRPANPMNSRRFITTIRLTMTASRALFGSPSPLNVTDGRRKTAGMARKLVLKTVRELPLSSNDTVTVATRVATEPFPLCIGPQVVPLITMLMVMYIRTVGTIVI